MPLLGIPWYLMGKDKHKKSQVCVCVCVCVCVVVVMVTALPARQGAQQPEHLAYPRGHPVASTLWDSAMGTSLIPGQETKVPHAAGCS